MRFWFLVILSVGILGACQTAVPDPEAIPTRAELPTAFNLTDEAESTDVVQRRTLPPTFTPTFTPTTTETPTPTPTAEFSATASLVPSATITNTATAVPSPLPTIAPDERPILGLLEIMSQATVLPDDFQVPDFDGIDVTLPPTLAEGDTILSLEDLTATAGAPQNNGNNGGEVIAIDLECAFDPPAGFSTLYNSNPDIALQIGCPVGSPPSAAQSQGALQEFEQGTMLWVQSSNTITVLYEASDLYEQFPDTFAQGTDPETSSETPPDGLLAPVRGFLKVWDANSQVRDQVGWATIPESAIPASVLNFENGAMIQVLNQNRTLVLIEPVQNFQWFVGS